MDDQARNTILFKSDDITEPKTTKEILESVYNSLEEKSYNAMDQMVGYIISGDPSYITSHNGARSMIRKIDRDDLIEDLLKAYLGK